MSEECLICRAPLEYLETSIMMECEICHKKETGKTRCINGHYVCDECHTQGLDSIIGLSLEETSRNPVEIIEKMMNRGKSVPGGPRCCKRDSFISILAAVRQINDTNHW